MHCMVIPHLRKNCAMRPYSGIVHEEKNRLSQDHLHRLFHVERVGRERRHPSNRTIQFSRYVAVDRSGSSAGIRGLPGCPNQTPDLCRLSIPPANRHPDTTDVGIRTRSDSMTQDISHCVAERVPATATRPQSAVAYSTSDLPSQRGCLELVYQRPCKAQSTSMFLQWDSGSKHPVVARGFSLPNRTTKLCCHTYLRADC